MLTKKYWIITPLIFYSILACAQMPPSIRAVGNYNLVVPPQIKSSNACSNNELQKGGCGSKPRFETEKKYTSETFDFIDPIPNRRLSAIKSAEVDGVLLVLRTVTKELFIEYRGPVVITVNKTIYDASPICSGIVHALTLGMFLVWKPIDSAQIAAGCTDEEIIKKEADGAKSVATGKVVWKDASANHKILVSGFAKDYEYEVLFNESQGVDGVVTIDLSTAINQTNFEGVTNLFVKCTTCSFLGEAEQKELENASVNASINFDFRPIKQAKVLATAAIAATRKAEEDKKVADQRLVDESKRLDEDRRRMEVERIAREGDGSEDDLACQKRKLKPSTSSYLNCRTSLVDKREKEVAAKSAAEEKKRIADEAREARRISAEQAIEERKKKEEATRVARIPQPLQNEFTGDGRLSLDVSKTKCIDLGFKPSTEGFGKCVLQLSK